MTCGYVLLHAYERLPTYTYASLSEHAAAHTWVDHHWAEIYSTCYKLPKKYSYFKGNDTLYGNWSGLAVPSDGSPCLVLDVLGNVTGVLEQSLIAGYPAYALGVRRVPNIKERCSPVARRLLRRSSRSAPAGTGRGRPPAAALARARRGGAWVRRAQQPYALGAPPAELQQRTHPTWRLSSSAVGPRHSRKVLWRVTGRGHGGGCKLPTAPARPVLRWPRRLANTGRGCRNGYGSSPVACGGRGWALDGAGQESITRL